MTSIKLDRDERERSQQPTEKPSAPAPPASLAWASAVGNQAVQSLARSMAVARAAEAEDEAEEEAVEAPPREAAELDEVEIPEELPE